MSISSTPTINDLRNALASIIEAVQVPTIDPSGATDWTTMVDNRWIVNREWPESFDIGEEPTILRSDSDQYTKTTDEGDITVSRVNAWIISDSGFSQQTMPAHNNEGGLIRLAHRRANMYTVNLRVFFFYEFGGIGDRGVADYLEAARRSINDAPLLGLTGVQADMVDGHNGLQNTLADSGDFKGTIAYIRGCNLQVRLYEPLNRP